MTEPDIVIAALKDAEKVALDAARGFDIKVSNAKNEISANEREAAGARARAAKFRAAITRLGA